MKEFVDKLISRLEELENLFIKGNSNNVATGVNRAIKTVNQLAEEYKLFGNSEQLNDGWIPCNDQLPPHSDDLLLIQCNGKPRNNISLVNAFCLASYTGEGWILEMYPEWKDADVVAWKNLGEPYQPKKRGVVMAECRKCKHNYKPSNCEPKCNRMCDGESDFEPITNYDRIHGMSIEELAEFFSILDHSCLDGKCFICFGVNYISDDERSILDWLQSESE